MIKYLCKYAPIEVYKAFSEEVSYLNPSVDNIDEDKIGVHRNICSYCKASIQFLREGGEGDLILTSCCNSMQTLEVNMDCEINIDKLSLPFNREACNIELYGDEILRLIGELEDRYGKKFDIQAFLNSFPQEEDGEEGPYIALMGSRIPQDTKKYIEKISPYRIKDLTCSGRREIERPEASGDLKDTIYSYAKNLLNRQACMRMSVTEDRRKIILDPNLRGIVYSTVSFCDFYGFEYSSLKKETDLPLVKIETDYSAQSSQQIKTRTQAFFETVVNKYDIKGESKISRKERSNRMISCGIDSGSTSTNCVIIKGDEILSSKSISTGTNVEESAKKALEACLKEAGLERGDLDQLVSTGYGRNRITESDREITEISCHAKGAYFLRPDVRTIIDIGGQDSKVIHLDDRGNVMNFAMNDKCAAGTGRFLELMAMSLSMSVEEMSKRGLKWKKEVPISSMCSVFAQSEVVSLIADGNEVEDIIHGLNASVVKKVLSMGGKKRMRSRFMMTGGVARNEGVLNLLQEELGEEVYVYENPEICGALGAAILAQEE